jgi:UPF0716 protein FxsA
LELWILFQLSDAFGFFTTLAIVLGTGILGASLAKWQGLQAIIRLQNEMRQGVLPAQALGDGALILVAGILLITPGVISDALGLLLLIPPVRKMVMIAVRHWLVKNVRVRSSGLWEVEKMSGEDTVRGSSTVVDARVIETHVVDERE